MGIKWKDKRVLVLGAGASGVAAKAFLERRGCHVSLYDDKDEDKPDFQAGEFDLAVLSPGFSIKHPIAKKFQSKITSELALGFCARTKKIIAVTGTNGKTTVVNMVHSALNARRKKSILVGNSGDPVTGLEHEIKRKIAITEVSSFMMEPHFIAHDKAKKPYRFRPKIAAILNISQDHLDRHDSMQIYAQHKAQITRHQRWCDKLVLNYDNNLTRDIARQTRARVYYFSTKTRVRVIYLMDGNVYLNLCKWGKPKQVLRQRDIPDRSEHSIQNLLASMLICHLARVSWKPLLNVKREKHKIQHVADIGNISFYNDSKATNISATLAACATFSAQIHLLIGGESKGQNFAQLFENLPSNVAHVFAFGPHAELMEEVAHGAGFHDISTYETMEDAIQSAQEAGEGPRVVLLSPAAASFDMFKNYRERGEKFIEAVEKLQGEMESGGEV